MHYRVLPPTIYEYVLNNCMRINELWKLNAEVGNISLLTGGGEIATTTIQE